MSYLRNTVALITLFVTSFAFAGFEKTNKSVPTTTIQQAKEMKHNSYVSIKGKITDKLRKEKYSFTDGKDTICIEIDNKHMPERKFDEKTNIIIHGEVEKEFEPFGDKCDKVKIDVDKVEFID